MPFDSDIAKLTLELSRLAYRPEAETGAGATAQGLGEFVFFDGGKSTQAFTATNADTRYLSFRGTETTQPRDWVVDAQFFPKDGALGEVHSGFDNALDEIWGAVLTEIAGDTRPLVITGHSLGGGLAIIAAARLSLDSNPPAAVYVFGCPRPGRVNFRDEYDSRMKDITFRVINHIDIVTRVPLLYQNYRAPGHRMYFDKSGTFHPEASAWQVIKEDVIYRLTNFRSIKALGLGNHEIGSYRTSVGAL